MCQGTTIYQLIQHLMNKPDFNEFDVSFGEVTELSPMCVPHEVINLHGLFAIYLRKFPLLLLLSLSTVLSPLKHRKEMASTSLNGGINGF